MKTKSSISLVAMAAMLSLIASTGFTLVPVQQDDNGVAVYDYSNFGAVGTFTSVTDPANSKVTHIYANMRITGHYGSGSVGGSIGEGSGAWNVEEVTWFNANGTVAKTHDVVNNVTDYYSVNGKLIRREVVLEGPGIPKQTCTSYPKYNSDGSYTLETMGLFKDPTKADGEGSTYVGVRSKVYVDANGRTQWEESYGLDESGNKTTAKSTFVYDAAGNLQYRQTADQQGRVTSTLYYKFGRPDHAVNTEYLPSGDTNTGTTTGPTQTTVKYNYSGNRLVSTQSYDKTGKLAETTNFDAFGRASTVTDAMGRTIGKYEYNDSGHDVTVSLGGYTVTVKPGGCSLYIATTYDANTGATKVDHTIYINGNTNTPMCTKTVSGGTTTSGTGTTGTGTSTPAPTAAPTSLTADQVKALQTQEDAQTATVNQLRINLNTLAGQVAEARTSGASNLNTLITQRDEAQKSYDAQLTILLNLRDQITKAGASFI